MYENLKLLEERDSLKYFLSSNFDNAYLDPIKYYVETKIKNKNWDDYNEYIHALEFFKEIKKSSDLWLDCHLLMENTSLIGALFIVGGKIASIEKRLNIENEKNSLILKYFHIKKKGRGYGTHWINSVIKPYYSKSYNKIYVASSHPDSFPFYLRFGKETKNYEILSDNKKELRKGKIFILNI